MWWGFLYFRFCLSKSPIEEILCGIQADLRTERVSLPWKKAKYIKDSGSSDKWGIPGSPGHLNTALEQSDVIEGLRPKEHLSKVEISGQHSVAVKSKMVALDSSPAILLSNLKILISPL